MKAPAALGSFRRQIVVLTASVTAFAMLLLTVALQLILADLSRNSVDRVLRDRADAVKSSVIAASTADRLVVPDSDLDIGVVVYDADGGAVGGTASLGLVSDYDSLAGVDRSRFVNVGDTVRLVAEPFTTPGGTSGVVVVGERLAPYENAERYALIVSLVTGALATAAAAAIAAWVVTRALRPVATLATTAADWSEHDLTRRFDLGKPTNEITGLAAVLDTLLDKVTAAIQSEQRLTSELAHELRTPLTSVQGTAELVLMRDGLSPQVRADLEQISAEAHRMTNTITALLELARSEASRMDASSCSLADIVEEVVQTTRTGDTVVEVEVADQRLAVPRVIALRAVTPVVENAMRFAASRVLISDAPGAGGQVRLWVEDDGPGVSGAVERIFEPGTSSGTGSGAGLGLAIARRMARSSGGDVELTRPHGPTRFEVRLPRG